MPVISVQKLIGSGYNQAWFTNCKARYRIFFGARNTKKSYNICGIEPIIKILSSNERNIVMFRANDIDNGESTYANLRQKITLLGLDHLFKCTTSPYKITKKSTGQVILFRGAANNPTSITSIQATVGRITDFYFEEASELPSYEDFRKIDGSLRGITKDGSALQISFCLNPWDIDSWIHEVFCKDFDPDINKLEKDGYEIYENPEFNLGFGKGLLIHTSSYKINEFRDPSYDEGANILKNTSYHIWLTEFMGKWGNTQASCYPDWKDDLILDTEQIRNVPIGDFTIGVDVGISDGQGRVLRQDGEVKSATTMALAVLTQDRTKIVIMDEFFHTNIGLKLPKTEPEIQQLMCEKIKAWGERFPWMKYARTRVLVDSASPGFMQTLRDMAHTRYGLHNLVFMPSTKIKIHNRINFTNYLMAFKEFYVANTCTNLIREIKQAHKGPKGEPRGTNDHEIDATEYAMTPLWGKTRRFRSFKFIEGEDKKLNTL